MCSFLQNTSVVFHTKCYLTASLQLFIASEMIRNSLLSTYVSFEKLFKTNESMFQASKRSLDIALVRYFGVPQIMLTNTAFIRKSIFFASCFDFT